MAWSPPQGLFGRLSAGEAPISSSYYPDLLEPIDLQRLQRRSLQKGRGGRQHRGGRGVEGLPAARMARVSRAGPVGVWEALAAVVGRKKQLRQWHSRAWEVSEH
jgi:hypothetical protein